MVNPALDGLDGEDSNLVEFNADADLEAQLKTPTDTRLFAVQKALEHGWSVDRVHDLTKIDRWFLSKLKNIAQMRQALKACSGLDELKSSNGRERLRALKMAGFSDSQIARYLHLPS